MTTIAEIERAIEELGVGTPEYHEAMAMYLMTMARAQWRLADRARIRRPAHRATGVVDPLDVLARRVHGDPDA